MVKRLTILIVALAAVSLSGSAAWACSESDCGGKTATMTSADGGTPVTLVADHNTNPKGGADEAAAPADKSGTGCPYLDGACGSHSASNMAKKTASADPKSKTDCPITADCPASKCGNAANCTKKMAAECPYMTKTKKVTAQADKASPSEVPGGGVPSAKPEAAPSDPKAAPDAKTDAANDKKAYTVGSKVKDFDLTNVKTDKPEKLSTLEGKKVTALIFWNQQCPYVHEAQGRVAQFQKDFKDKGVNVVAVDAGVNNSPESIKKYAEDKPFQILMNRDSKVAAQFGATHTPEVFLLDANNVVQYHGAFDSGRIRHEGDSRKNYVINAVDQMLKGEKPTTAETRSFGCSLKYAEGVKPLK